MTVSYGSKCAIDACRMPASRLLPGWLPICLDHARIVYQTLDGIPDERERLLHHPAARAAGGWIYFIRFGDRIKIGHTTNLKQRLAAYPPDARLMAVQPGSRDDEKALHQLYQSYCVSGREWYGAHHEPILALIAKARDEHGDPETLQVAPKRARRANSSPAAIRGWSGRT